MTISKRDVTDITFIGSGIATSYALLGLLDRLNNLDSTDVLNINIIDKYPDFFCGILGDNFLWSSAKNEFPFVNNSYSVTQFFSFFKRIIHKIYFFEFTKKIY